MEEWKIVLIIIASCMYVVYNCFAIGYIGEISKDNGGFYPLTPKSLYREYHVNWLGAIMLYLLSIFVNPVWLIISWIYIIFTAGRK